MLDLFWHRVRPPLFGLVSALGKVLVRLAGNGRYNLQLRDYGWSPMLMPISRYGFVKAFNFHGITITHNPFSAPACLWIQ
jgi:hypothetical protein